MCQLPVFNKKRHKMNQIKRIDSITLKSMNLKEQITIANLNQVGNGNQQYFTEATTTTPADDEADDTYDETQPQPLTDLNPSAGNFAAVRNRFEQLSIRADTNGAETPATLTTLPVPLNQGAVKRLSGNFEEAPLQVRSSFSNNYPINSMKLCSMSSN